MDANPQPLVPSDFEELEDFTAAPVAEEPKPRPPLSLVPLHDVPVRVQAVLGRTRLTVDELLGLQPGSVVELDRRAGEPVDLLVNGRLIARGELVLVEGALGVTLTELVSAEA